ncbi:MAG: lysophospholipid acyltransferase family protein [Tannerella sp.]|jgi:KDO2-lipid IV(A) lauroyltransferase|nr:lysophospholipid acyltransferase family protein [Tannerella sp.]
MGNKILYAFLFVWVKIHAILPMRVLYILSDIMYFLIYHVARYRRKIVRKNMTNSFPDKTEKEIARLERRFYHHFADYIMETIKLAHISQKELLRRADIRNPELVFELLDKGHTCMIMIMGHYGNWEWFSGATAHFQGRATIYQVYRPLKNKAFDRLFIYLRTRFHSHGIKKKDTVRDMITLKRNKTHALLPFLADQTPSKANLHYWTTFMNQDSAILTGPERIAKKLDVPIIFADTQKTKRGYYTVDFKLLTDNAKDTPEFWITEQYTRMMEACILRDPAYWLWTHNRWKYKRE